MGKVWVLDTETKGTGANMVPLERVLSKRSAPTEPPFVRKPRQREQPPPEPTPKEQHRFRIVEVMTRRELAADAGVREAVDALRHVPSVVDVSIYVWQADRERWRMLTFDERSALWQLAHE